MISRLSRDDPLAKDPTTIALYMFALFFISLFVLYPLAKGFVPTLSDGGVYYKKFLDERLYRDAVINTLLMVALSTPTATALGFIYAYALAKWRVPFRKFFTYTILLQLIAPPFASGLAFLMLFGRNGIASRLLNDLLGVELNLYGAIGLWIVQTITFFPIAFLVLYGAIKALDPTYDYVARTLGAPPLRAFIDVDLRLLKPAILSALTLVAMYVLEDFGNPLLVGGDFYVLAVLAYMNVVGWGDYVGGAATAYVLLILVLLFFVAQWKILGRARYTTVTGRESYVEVREPPFWVKVPALAIMTASSLFIVTIYSSIILGAFTKTWGVDYTPTLDHFRQVSYAATFTLRNSLTVAIASAIFCALLGFLVAYMISFRRISLTNKYLEVVGTMPSAIPGTLLGIAYILAFAGPPLVLTGTIFIIIVNNVVRFLPLSLQSYKSVLTKIDQAIEENSVVLGAGAVTTMTRVILPLASVGFLSSFVYAFIKSMNTVSAVIFLETPRTKLLAPFILGLGTHGYWGQAAALSTLLIATVVVFLVSLKLLMGRRVKVFEEFL